MKKSITNRVFTSLADTQLLSILKNPIDWLKKHVNHNLKEYRVQDNDCIVTAIHCIDCGELYLVDREEVK